MRWTGEQAWQWHRGSTEPELWFHDILHPDGRPYRRRDIEAIWQHTEQA